jgi:hemerythrin-like metal-binding protein
MPRFRRSKSNTVFDPEIDHQHGEIDHAGEALQQACHSDASPARIMETVHALTAVIEAHFAHEERLMRRSHYEFFSWHKQQHDTLRRRVKEFAIEIEAGDRDAAPALHLFFNKWLHEHTGLTDRMMASFLRNRRRADA